MSKRLLALAAMSACAGLVLTGCGSNSGAPPKPTTVAATTLTHVIDADPDTLNPALSSRPQNRIVGCMIYQGLTRVDKNYKAQPQLAREWTVSPDGKDYVFTLQKAKWTDGKDLTSKDVVYSLTEVAKLSPSFASANAVIDSITAPDDSTVEIKLKQPFAPFLMSLSCDSGGAAILPSHLFEGTDPATNPASIQSPVGTGPFMLKSWQSGSKITLEKNPNYWRKGQPYLEQVVAKVIPAANARVLALLSGEVDFIYHVWVDRNALAPVEKSPKYQLVNQGPPGDFDMVYNVRNAPYSDVRVRQALLTAIDRDFIISGPMKGYGAPGSSAISSELAWAHNPKVDLMKKYPYDPKAAKALLEKAGYAKGLKVRLSFDAGNPVLQATAEAIASFWKEVGVEAVLQGSELATALDQVFKQWDFDVSLWGYTSSGDPALGISRLYVSTSIAKATYNNGSGYSNPEVDRLFADGARHTDQKNRIAPYFEVQKILAEDVPTVPLIQVPNIHAGVAGIQGMFEGLMQYGDWWDGVSLK